MKSDKLLSFAEKACRKSLELAEQTLGFTLPREFLCGIGVDGFVGDVFTLAESVEILLHESKFPYPVDLAVRGIVDGKAFILWIPCGREVGWLPMEGTQTFGPFKPMGLMVPSRYGTNTMSEESLYLLGKDWCRGIF